MGKKRAKNSVEHRDAQLSVSDPALAAYLAVGTQSYAGVQVTERTALGSAALWRVVSLIAGTIAALPFRSYRRLDDGARAAIRTFLDDPGGVVGLTPFEWLELVMTHLLLHGNAYLLHVLNGAGALAGLQPIHPACVSVERDAALGKVFRVTLDGGEQRILTPLDLTHITGLSTDGLVGLNAIAMLRQTIGTGLAGDRAAAKMFSSGLLVAGLVTTEDDVTEDEAKTIKVGLDAKVAGWDNAGGVAFVNRNLKFSPWAMKADEAQFLEARQFSVEEIARAYGVPKVLLAQDGASTWGSGIAELVRGMQRFTFAPWTSRLEQRLSALLPRPQYVEFDYAGLLQPSPAEEITLLIQQVQAGLLTLDEARRLRNLPPLPAAVPSPAAGEPAAVGAG